MNAETYGKISLRDAFGTELVKAGEKWQDLVVLDAGTSNSTMSERFARVFPDRFYTPGINELGMIGLATGMAMAGKRVVACDMSVFLHHAYAHIREAARQGDIHMVIAASHTGVAVGPDGGSAHDVTDIARMRLVPGFSVLTPWDGAQVKAVLNTILERRGLYYLRLNRPPVPIFLKEPLKFEIGKAVRLTEGSAITIVACGDKVYNALLAAERLNGAAEVIGVSTVEPLDMNTIYASAVKTGRVVTYEDHLAIGGLYEAVAGGLAGLAPTRMRSASVPRIFTTSGEPDELEKLYRLDLDSLVDLCRKFIAEPAAK